MFYAATFFLMSKTISLLNLQLLPHLTIAQNKKQNVYDFPSWLFLDLLHTRCCVCQYGIFMQTFLSKRLIFLGKIFWLVVDLPGPDSMHSCHSLRIFPLIFPHQLIFGRVTDGRYGPLFLRVFLPTSSCHLSCTHTYVHYLQALNCFSITWPLASLLPVCLRQLQKHMNI